MHVIQGFFPIQSSLPRSVFDNPFLAAFHGLGDIKEHTKPKTRPPTPPPIDRFVRDLQPTFDCI